MASMTDFIDCEHITPVNEECQIQASLIKIESPLNRTEQEENMEIIAKALGRRIRTDSPLPEPILDQDNLCARCVECPYYSPRKEA